MRATLLLADYAQGGPGTKINAIGLGWTGIPSPLPQHSLLLLIDFEPGEPTADITAKLSLVDAQGESVCDANGAEISAKIELNSAAQSHAEEPVLLPVTLGISQGMPLQPGLHRWLAEIDCGEQREFVSRPFMARKSDESSNSSFTLMVDE